MIQTQRDKLIRLIILAAALCLGMSSPVHAAKKKTKSQEVYSATEQELSSDEGTAVLPPPPTGLSSTATKVEKKTASAGLATPIASNKDESLSERVQALEKEIETLKSKNTASAEPPKNPFDNVPENQRAGIAKRLELVADLIKRHGRAYDYRQHTLKELRSIISELDDRSFDSRAGQPINSQVSGDFASSPATRRMASHMSPNTF
jgi:hypothetical protein